MSEYLSEEIWKDRINRSNVFFILGTEEYFKKAVLFEQSWYAKRKKKKFIVALKKGAKIPEGFPIAGDAIKFVWDNQKDLVEKCRKAFEKYGMN